MYACWVLLATRMPLKFRVRTRRVLFDEGAPGPLVARQTIRLLTHNSEGFRRTKHGGKCAMFEIDVPYIASGRGWTGLKHSRLCRALKWHMFGTHRSLRAKCWIA